MSRRRRGSRLLRSLLVAAIVLGGLALWPVIAPPPREDRTPACRELVRVVEAAGAKRGLIAAGGAPRPESRTAEGIRWEIVDRTFRVPPPATARSAAASLRRAAVARGFLVRVEAAGPDRLALEAAFPDGRPALRVLLRPQRWIALIIDDMGYSRETARRICALPCRLTCAIIPGTKWARDVSAMARRRGKEVMLHLPMQSPFASPDVPEYATMIRHGMSKAEVADRVHGALKAVPGARAVNNHEGSSATADADLMAHVMLALKPLELGFVDSVTIPTSVAWRMAREAGLRWGRRDVFLDDDRSLDAVERQFAKAVATAVRKGVAIVIGHHSAPATLDVLERRIPEAERSGIEFVHATAALRGGR